MHWSLLLLRRLAGASGVLLAVVSVPMTTSAQDRCAPSGASPVPPSLSKDTPELSIDGLANFVSEHGIDNVEGLLDAMPPSMTRNYTLMEESGTGRPASVDQPRIILFGSDARFLVALGSHEDDPQREVADLAELEETGHWKLRSLDFRESPPKLSKDDAACAACHGQPARPLWGSYLQWPGAYGDGPDRLDGAQARALTRLAETREPRDRFAALEFADPFGRRGRAWSGGDFFVLPGRNYPYANTSFSSELSYAIADGVHKRVSQSPYYRELRDELLWYSFCEDSTNGQALRRTGGEGEMRAHLAGLGAKLGVQDDKYHVEDEIYRIWGVEPDSAMRPDHRAIDPFPTRNTWNGTNHRVYDLVDLLVLDELRQEDPEIASVLRSPERRTALNSGCFDTIEEDLDYRIVQGFTLRGEERQAAREFHYDSSITRIHQGLLSQIANPLCEQVARRIGENVDARDCADGVDNDGDGAVDLEDAECFPGSLLSERGLAGAGCGRGAVLAWIAPMVHGARLRRLRRRR